MTGIGIRIEDIFFMPCISFNDLESIDRKLQNGDLYEIHLAARHKTDYIPANVTLCYITEVIPNLQSTNNPHQFNLYRLKVEKDDAHATIELNFPEYEFGIVESNERFNQLILKSLELGSQ